MVWPSRILALAALVALFGAPRVEAQEVQRVALQVRVSHVSPAPGPIDDPELDRHLRGQFKYASLRQLQREQLSLAINEIGKVKMPNGRWVKLRPLNAAPGSLLVAVDVEEGMKMDLKMHGRKLAILGGTRYKDGTLVIVLQRVD